MVYPPLYILRHGQTVWNAEHRIQGSKDSPLTDKGRAQAEAQREILAAQDLTGFSAYTSPQGRAMSTAQIALRDFNLNLVQDARLAEIGVGDWEGLRREDLVLSEPVDESEESALDLYERAPGGEGFQALRARCQAFLADLKGPSVLVTHGITSRMLRLLALDLDIADIGRVGGGQGVIYFVEGGKSMCLEVSSSLAGAQKAQ